MKENASHLRNDVKMQEMALERTEICKIPWGGGGGGMQTPLEACAFGARVSASSAKKYLPKHKRRTPLDRIHPTGLMIMGKTKWGLKPTSSSKAVGPKQKRLWRVKLSALRNYRGTTVAACIVSVNTKILAAFQSKSRRINLFKRNFVENREVSKLLIRNVRVNIRS